MKVRATVLLVDDNPDDREIYTEVLAHEQFHVIVATDTHRAVELARAESPDVVVLNVDRSSPSSLDSITVLRDHEETASVPVICLTALVLPPKDVLALGFSQILEKPVRPEDLVTAVERQVALSGVSDTGHANHPVAPQ